MRPHLVVVRCGRDSLHPGWTRGAPDRSFDLWTCPYEASPPGDEGTPASVVPGAKWSGLARFLEREPGWRAYAYVWLPDDDLAADAATLSRFFAACAAHGAALAAPALAEGSQHSHVLTLRNRAFRARETTFVEVMAPCFRRDVLERLLPTFRATASGEGWGLDDAWGRLLGYRGMLVVDDATVRHDRPVGASRGRAQRRALREEMRSVRARFDACSMRKTVGGTTSQGEVVSEGSPRFLDAYVEGYRWLLGSDAAREARLRRQQADDPAVWLAGAAARAAGPASRRWWGRLLGRPGRRAVPR